MKGYKQNDVITYLNDGRNSSAPVKFIDTDGIPPKGRLFQYWKANGLIPPQKKAFNYKVQTDPVKMVEHFNLKSLEFGRWTMEPERLMFVYMAADALHNLATILNLKDSELGQNRLSLAFGARGWPGSIAHYESLHTAINIHKKSVDVGSLAHEFGHYLDNMAAKGNKYNFASGGISTALSIDKDKITRQDFSGDFERLFQLIFFNSNESVEETKFREELRKKGTNYQKRRAEIFARIFEAVIGNMAARKGIANNILAQSPAIYNSEANIANYGGKELISKLEPQIISLARSILTDKKEPTVTIDKPVKTPQKSNTAEKKSGVTKSRASIKSYKSIDRIIGIATTIDTPQGKIEADYALVNIDDIIASNNPFTFKPEPKYPKSCQTRNYGETKSEQSKVLNYASNFQPRHLVNDSPDATTGPPIIIQGGIVLGGNGRTMVLKRIAEKKYKEYEQYLRSRLSNYLNPDAYKKAISELSDKKKLVLVRILKKDIDTDNKCSEFSNRLNENLTQSQDATTKGIGYAQAITEAKFAELANIMAEQEGTFVQILNNGKINKRIIDLLKKSGIITSSNYSTWIDEKTNELSKNGRILLENLLVGKVLQEKSLIEAASNYTNKIIKALPILLQIQILPAAYNIAPNLQEAFKHEIKRRRSGMSKSDYLKQNDMFGGGKKDVVPEKTALIWLSLDGHEFRFRDILKKYLNTARNETSGNNLFGTKSASANDILKKYIEPDSGLSDKIRMQSDYLTWCIGIGIAAIIGAGLYYRYNEGIENELF